MPGGVLVLACGALARELEALRRAGPLAHVTLRCLDAALHNRPELIAPAVEEAVLRFREEFDHVFVAYADCGTGGGLDRVLERLAVARLPGAHCYEFYAGSATFAALADAEPGTFYLTDFLVRHFDRLVREGLGLDRYPALRDQYFGNYRRVVHLAQVEDAELDALAREQAAWLGLSHQRVFTGMDPLLAAIPTQVLQWRN